MVHVTIVGAGPGGLALARQMERHGISYQVLEKANRVGSTFHEMTANTTYGPWLNSRLPDGPVPWTWLLKRATREQYSEYLLNYALKHDLKVRTGVTVTEVQRQPGGFRLQTTAGPMDTTFLVNASGYFSKPFVPQVPGRCSIPRIHSSEFKGLATARELIGRNRGRVLVVGGRLSAGETMAILYRAGYEVVLSHGSPIDFFPSAVTEFCLAPLTQLLEEIRARIPGTSRPWNLNVRMNGDEHRRLIQTGLVPVWPEIARFEDEHVVFTDGRQAYFDLIVYGTGYRPALDHLHGLIGVDELSGLPPLRGFESREAPGLFFLGLIGLRTFRSQFLRGLRDDSLLLGEVLAKRLTDGKGLAGPPLWTRRPEAVQSAEVKS